MPDPRGALITGANRGVGRALALALAADGYAIAVNYRTQREEAERVVAEAQALGASAHALPADVTDPDQAARLVHEAHERTGGLRALINNVGNYHHGPLDQLSVETWHQMFDSNLHSTFYTCQNAIPLMRPHGGRIINLGYAGAENLTARPAIAPYSIAKTGVILYTKAIARTEAKHGITANVISPGVLENSDTVPLREIPMDRVGRLTELVAAARYLLSDEAAYVTGVTIEVAGGWNL